MRAVSQGHVSTFCRTELLWFQPYSNIGSTHNRAARPFPGFGGGAPANQQPVAPPQYAGGSAFAAVENSQQDYSAQQSRMTAGMAK